MRLELLSIERGEVDPERVAQPNGACPPGMRRSAGKCSKNTDDAPHLCQPNDVSDCSTQCNRGDARSCYQLALSFRQGRGIQASESQAAKYFGLACEQGEPSGCSGLAELTQLGLGGTTASAERARELYQKACEQGDALGCTNLGVLYAKGEGGTRDDGRAQVLFRIGCDAGSKDACFNAGVVAHRNGDTAAQTKFNRLACDGGKIAACVNLGVQYGEGRGVPRDYGKAFELAKRACDSSAAAPNDKHAGAGCHNLAELVRDGTGTKKDRARAIELFRRGCQAEIPDSCQQLKLLGAP